MLAAPGKLLVDFGLRRAHGAGSRSARRKVKLLVSPGFDGFDGTATVAAGQRFGIPLFGTMAHSYIEAHESESDARSRVFPPSIRIM